MATTTTRSKKKKPSRRPTLRQARVALGWTQSRLGRVSGVPQSLISAIEHRTRTAPELRTWRKLSAALGVELYPKCGVPASFYTFRNSAACEELDDEALGAMIDIACSRPGWRRAPVTAWVDLAGIVRAWIALEPPDTDT